MTHAHMCQCIGTSGVAPYDGMPSCMRYDADDALVLLHDAPCGKPADVFFIGVSMCWRCALAHATSIVYNMHDDTGMVHDGAYIVIVPIPDRDVTP